jgi:hypothetical protein
LHSLTNHLQVKEGGFIGKDMQLLEALERQLYRLDGIRAASGYKLSPQARLHACFQILLSSMLQQVSEVQRELRDDVCCCLGIVRTTADTQ